MVLEELKSNLENKIGELRQELEEVETEREQNKTALQSVETKITQKEPFDVIETLLKLKEDLLQSDWKLQEKKNNYEKQLIDLEKWLRPIEIKLMRTRKRSKNGNVIIQQHETCVS